MRIGLFGGTFDPPHIGHIVLASEAKYQLKLDTVFWILTPDPPHKTGQVISDSTIRTRMVKQAIVRYPEFTFSDLEFQRPGPHYAVDTVRLFRSRFPEAELFYLIGGDSLNDLPEWHDPSGFVSECDAIITMMREGEIPDWQKLDSDLPELRKKTSFLNTPIIGISSHAIRDRVHNDQTWRCYVDAGVEAIIMDHQLYK